MQAVIRLQQASRLHAAEDHSYALGSAHYEALRAFYPEASRKLHESPERAAYTFGEIQRQPGWKGRAWYAIAAEDHVFLRLLLGALVASRRLQVMRSEYDVTGLELVADEPPRDEIQVRTLSPIFLRREKRPTTADDPDYLEALTANINDGLATRASITEPVRVEGWSPQPPRRRHLGGIIVLAQPASFTLVGTRAALRHVLDVGVGQSTGLGFGMLARVDGPLLRSESRRA